MIRPISSNVASKVVAAIADIEPIHNNYLVNFNGVSQYIVIPEIPIGSDIELTVRPTSNGNSGLPSDCPALTDGTIQTVTFTTTESITELARNGANYYNGALLGMKFDGVNYRFDEGWSLDSSVLVNYAVDLGEELVSNGDFSTATDLSGWFNLSIDDADLIDGCLVYDREGTQYIRQNITSKIDHNTTYLQTCEYFENDTSLNGIEVRTNLPELNYPSEAYANYEEGVSKTTFTVPDSFSGNLYAYWIAGDAHDIKVTRASIKQADGYGKYIGLTEASWTEETV